jgi:hypothetical protein
MSMLVLISKVTTSLVWNVVSVTLMSACGQGFGFQRKQPEAAKNKPFLGFHDVSGSTSES